MDNAKNGLQNHKDRKFPKKICFIPIGIIHAPFETLKEILIQFSMSNVKGVIEIFPEYNSALKDLDGFSHIYRIYYFDMVKLSVRLISKPFLDEIESGAFASRTPFRPNTIGISVLEILEIKNNMISVNSLDILNKTPILDIKPYIPQFDMIDAKKIGWLKGKIMEKGS